MLAWAMTWVDAIAQLYRLNDLRLEEPRGSARFTEHDIALRKALQDMADQRARLLSEATLGESALKVLRSMDRHWAGLLVFVDHPAVPMDNNIAERSHRTPVVGRKNFWFFRTICGRFGAILCLRDELPTASVGRFIASADRPPPWTTLHCRRRRNRGRRSLHQSDGSALADSRKKRFSFRQVASSESCSDSLMRGHISGPPSSRVSCRRASLTCFLASSSSS